MARIHHSVMFGVLVFSFGSLFLVALLHTRELTIGSVVNVSNLATACQRLKEHRRKFMK